MGAYKRQLNQKQQKKKRKRYKKYTKGVRKDRINRKLEHAKRERALEKKEQLYKKLGIRPPVLEQTKAIWLTSRGYRLLRQAKKKQNLSMAQILDNILFEALGEKTEE